MTFKVLTNITDHSDAYGNQKAGVVIIGAGEEVAVHENSWRDKKDFVWIDAPDHATALRVHKSILQPE